MTLGGEKRGRRRVRKKKGEKRRKRNRLRRRVIPFVLSTTVEKFPVDPRRKKKGGDSRRKGEGEGLKALNEDSGTNHLLLSTIQTCATT